MKEQHDNFQLCLKHTLLFFEYLSGEMKTTTKASTNWASILTHAVVFLMCPRSDLPSHNGFSEAVET